VEENVLRKKRGIIMGENKKFNNIEKVNEAILHIRNTSKSGHLMPKDTLHDVLSIEKEQVDALLEAISEKPELIEIKTINDDEGNVFFYSATEMTDKYANILMSVNNKNFLKLIADTVRYESKTYPRPTRLSLFTLRPYNIKENVLLGLLSSLNSKSEYADLKYTEASNGVKFIYSEEYMTARYANTLAEWDEVLQKEIP